MPASTTKSVASKTGAAKKAAKSSAAGSRSPAAPEGKAPKKASAKKAAAKAPAKKRAVTYNGKPAKNRHFLLDPALLASVTKRAQKFGLKVSDVLRHGLEKYGEDAPAADKVVPALSLLPDAGIEGIRTVWNSNDSATVSNYLAALSRAGWPMQVIADSVVAAGVAKSMTRQAVSLRVLKAPEVLMDGLPEVPELGRRRPIVSHRKGVKGRARPAERKASLDAHDLSFRITDEDYERAARRAKHEGAMMSAVVDGILEDFLAGRFDAAFKEPVKGD